MVSAAMACLPAAVSLLLLEALFMQISGVSLVLTWPRRLCLLRVLLCGSLCYKLSPFQVHWEKCHWTRVLRPTCLFTVHVGGGSSSLSCAVFLPPPLSQAFLLLITGRCCCFCQPPCLFTVHVRSGSSPLSCGVFLPLPLSQAFLLLVAPARASPTRPACLFTVPGRISLPPLFSAQCIPPSFLCSLLFLLLIIQFLFFPRVEVSLSRGLCWSDPGLSVGVPCTAKLTLSTSSQALWVQATGGPGALLVSLLMWIGDALCRLEVWRGQIFSSSPWFCLQGVSPVSLQDFIIGGTLSASSF
jgi:hypothetical protein